VLDVYRRSLTPITPEQASAEPISRLFYERLIDLTTGAYPGGRLASFYVGKTLRFSGAELTWDQFANARLIINGIEYRDTVGQLFDRAHARLRPALLTDAGGV